MRNPAITILILICLIHNTTAQIINVPADQPSIQAGIDAATEGDTVLVADSTYYENINFKGKAITVTSHFLVDGDTSHISRTIIDGSQPDNADTASTVLMISGEDSTSVLYGFTVTGGRGTIIDIKDLPPSYALVRTGGGILIIDGGCKIEHNIIRDIHMDFTIETYGGGIACYFASNERTDQKNIIIQNNSIMQNYLVSADNAIGAGLYISVESAVSDYTGNVIIQDNIISYNNSSAADVSMGSGIGIFMVLPTMNGEFAIRNNVITYNKNHNGNYNHGGGIYVVYWSSAADSNSSPLIYNNIIADNESQRDGGGISVYAFHNIRKPEISPKPVVINNTLVNNSAPKGPGLWTDTKADPLLLNNIFWNNSTQTNPELSGMNSALIKYNNIRGYRDQAGGINISVDPGFAEDSYELQENSLCIGMGIDSILLEGIWYFAPATDLQGNGRPHEADPYLDIGAFESPYPKLPSADLTYIGFWNRILRPSFHKDTLAYILDVPDTVSVSPQLDIVPFDWNAEVEIDPAKNPEDPVSAEDSTMTITVTSYDGGTTKTYTVAFNRLSTDATLKELTVSRGILSPVFDPQTLNYFVALPFGSTETPLTTCEVNDPAASVEIHPAEKVNDWGNLSRRTTLVIVIAEDPGAAFRKAYEIEFNVDRQRPVLSLINDTVRLDENILVTSTEDGHIYLVSLNTEDILDSIDANQLQSAYITASDTVSMPASDLEVSTSYLLYGVDNLNSISEPVTVTIICEVGIQEIISAAVRLYPVPVEDLLRIETDYQVSSIELYNALGVKVMDAELTEDGIHLGHLVKGIYFITIRSKNFIRTDKIIKL